MVPPPRLISKCLKKLVNDGGRGTLIAPKWLSAPFWPLFYPDGKTSATFIVDSLELPQVILTAKGRGKNGVFGGQSLKFKLVAFRINGNFKLNTWRFNNNAMLNIFIRFFMLNTFQ